VSKQVKHLKRQNEVREVRVSLTGHFQDQWTSYLGREKPNKVRARLRSALLNQVIYGRADGSFEVQVAVNGKRTKAILELTGSCWVAVTLLHPECAEMLLERAGLGDVARKHGARLNCGRY